MDQWRKRISRIATSFEVANKAELKTAEKQVLHSKAKQVSRPTDPHFLHSFSLTRQCSYVSIHKLYMGLLPDLVIPCGYNLDMEFAPNA